MRSLGAPSNPSCGTDAAADVYGFALIASAALGPVVGAAILALALIEANFGNIGLYRSFFDVGAGAGAVSRSRG